MRRVSAGAAMLTAAFGLGMAVAALILVGPPPWLRVDVLWLRSHWNAWRLVAIGCGLVVLAFGVVWLVRHQRVALTVLVVGVSAVCAYWFRDRLDVVLNVLGLA